MHVTGSIDDGMDVREFCFYFVFSNNQASCFHLYGHPVLVNTISK